MNDRMESDYHDHSAYSLPQPQYQDEAVRLNEQHAIFQLAIGETPSSVARLKLVSSRRVLDLGCGTGIWVKEIAQLLPLAEIQGVDLSPPDPKPLDCPSNCSFWKCDVQQPWVFPNMYDSYDYIHASMLNFGIRDWPAVFDMVARHLRPGAVFEIFDGVSELHAASLPPSFSSPAIDWFNKSMAFVTSNGVDAFAPKDFVEQIQSVQMEVIERRLVETHLNPSLSQTGTNTDRQRIAAFQYHNWSLLIDRITPLMAKGSNDPASITALAEAAKHDLKTNGHAHGYHIKFYYVVARKPE